MINATDLRLGNWLSVGNGEIQSTVEAISLDKVKLTGNAIFNRLEHLNGIPLTEDILLKCGAVDGDIKLKENCTLFVCIKKGTGFHNEGKAVIYVHGTPIYAIDCEYLHTLQNAIFALTNQELTIEL